MPSVARPWRPRLAQHAGDLVVTLIALVARLAVLAWAGGRFPAAADGFYYQTIALRVAEGLGSTWLWPDGAVTYAAHYPIGYPALLAAVYRVFHTSVSVAGVLNALLGSLGALAAYRLALAATTRRWALMAGLAVALHPGLLAYTPALMTEGVTAALLACAAWCASTRSRSGCVMLGVTLGIATLVRPQSLLLAPLWGALCVRARPHDATRDGGRSATARAFAARARRAALATVVVLAVCAPWTARNCVRMKRCALVSVNGGWNLLIGAAPNATGAWAPVDVPEACKTVWAEAAKDDCFAREARKLIAADPVRWVARVPARLAATFDYCGAAGFYLHTSNAAAFPETAKVSLGVLETIYERLVYLGALIAAVRASGARRSARAVVALAGACALCSTHAYLTVLALVVVMLLRGRALLHDATLIPATGAALLATVAVHATFFGAGRYALVLFPLITACAFVQKAADTRIRGYGHHKVAG
jgi:hypothetical protein